MDLILERDGRLYPIEIKLTASPRTRDVSGLAAFAAAYPDHQVSPGLLVCAVDQPRRLTRDVLALPWNWIVSRDNAP